MRIRSLLLLTLVSLAAPLGAQESLASARRAREVLERGITAMGGIDALRRVSNITREMSGRRTDVGQGLTPSVQSDATNSLVVITDLAGRRFARWTRATILGGQPIHWHYALTPTFGFNANFANGTIRSMPVANLRNALIGQGRRWPEALLLAAWSSPEALRYLDRNVVAFADADGTAVNLVFDPRTGLLVRIEWLADDAVRGEGTSGVRYEDWRPVAGLRLPYRYVEVSLGSDLQSYQVESVAVNGALADSAFAPPPGLDSIPWNDGGSAERIGTGVWLLPGSYTSLAVEFRDHVLVLEGGGGTGLTLRQVAEARRLIPGKPIRYVVATHAHHDHVAGLRTYMSEGTTIVTTPQAAEVVRLAARSAHVLRPDSLARHPRAPVIEEVPDRRVFEDGQQVVELYQIGPNAHAQQILVAYLPAERLLFQADLLDISYGHASTGGEDTAQLAAAIQRLGLKVDRIVAVHSGVGPRALLDSALARRERPAGGP